MRIPALRRDLFVLAVVAAACSGEATAPNIRDTSRSQPARPAPFLVTLDVTPKSGATVALGSQFTFSAVVIRSDSVRVAPTELGWTTLAPGILAVNSVTGIANAVGVGSATVVAHSDGLELVVVVTVLPPPSPDRSNALSISSFSMIQYAPMVYAPQVNVTAAPGTSVTVLDAYFTIPGLGSIPPLGCGGLIPAGASRELNGEVYGDWLYAIGSESPPTSNDASVTVSFIDDTGATGAITSNGKIVVGGFPSTYTGGQNGGPCFHGRVP